MKYNRAQFQEQNYKMWESGLLLSDMDCGVIFFVHYLVKSDKKISILKLNASSPKDALERACYLVANLHRCRPEEVDLIAVFDHHQALVWRDPMSELGVVNFSRRDFLSRAGVFGASVYMGFNSQKLYAGSTTAPLSGTASGFTTESKGTLLDPNSYALIHATENEDYGSIIYAVANGIRDLSKSSGSWSPSGAGDFYDRPGLKDIYKQGYGSGSLTRINSVGSLSRSIGSNLLTTIGSSNGFIMSSSFFSSGSRVAAIYNFNGSGERRLMVWDTSTLPYTFGSYISLGGSGSVRVTVINDSIVIVFKGSEVSAYSVSGNNLTFISTTTFDSEAAYLMGACCVNWESSWGEVLVMYQASSSGSNVYVKALRFHSTNGFTIYSNRVVVGTSSYSASSATILPIPYYRAIILTNPGKFKVLKCTDWSTWNGSNDGSETTIGSLQFLGPFGSHSGLPRFAGLYDAGGGGSVYAYAMTVSDTSITAGAYCDMSSGYTGSARVNSWVRL